MVSRPGAGRPRPCRPIELSSFKVPTLWYVTERAEDVPRTASDKVDKAALQTLIQTRGGDAGHGRQATPPRKDHDT